MKDQILKIAGVKSEKEFYKKYPSEEAFMKAHGKAFKKAAMGSQMVNDQLHQLTDFGNPPIAQKGIGMPAKPQNFNKYFQGTNQPGLNPDGTVKQVGDAFNNAAMSQYSGQQAATQASAQYAPPSADQLLGKNDINSGATAASAPAFDAGAAGMAGLQGIGKIIGGIEAIGAQKKARQKNKQSNELGKLALEAQNTAQAPARKYVRPEDNLIQPGQMGNAYGSGTNFLAQNGTRIGGNPTEIQNMYNPGDMYTDLGFEPLGETLKQYRRGGNIPTAEFGDYFADSGEAQIGSAVGGAIAAGFGLPPGVGELGGKVLTNVLGIGKKGAREAEKLKQEGAMTNAQLAFGQNNTLGAFRKNGGPVDSEHKWISNSWQPQTFTKFGEYDAKDLLKPPHDADMLRSGGHLSEDYVQPSAEALYTGRPNVPQAQFGAIVGSMNKGMIDTFQNSPRANKLKQAVSAGMMEGGGKMALGGELQIGEGGYAETLSYNPNLPGGEIGMFRGASHDNGGIQTQYGENGVEVEGGEPFTILENYDLQNGSNNLEEGGTNKSLTVFGNIKIKKNIADLMGDPKAAGRKVKHYVADIAKNDKKQLKTIDKALDIIENSNNNSKFGQLGMQTGKLMKEGAEKQQEINAEKIKQAAIVQNAILDTASQLGVKSDKLAEGKLEKEKDPRMMAQDGIRLVGDPLTPAQRAKAQGPGGTMFYGDRTYITERGRLPLFARMLGAKPKPQYFNQEFTNKMINADDFSYLANKPYSENLTNDLMYGTRNYSAYNADLSNSLMYGTPYNQQSQQVELPTATQSEATQVATPVVSSTTSKGKRTTKAASNTKASSKVRNLDTSIIPTISSRPLISPSAPQTLNRETANVFESQPVLDNEATKKGGFNFGKLNLKKVGSLLNSDFSMAALSTLAPFLRPSNQEDLPPDQLYPEYYALATNQLEPVQAQTFQPMLDTPMDISLNDQLNAVDSQSRAAIRAAGQNPAAQAMIMAQSLEAKNKVLGEQARINAANKMQVYDKNRALVNDAQLRNLQILDQQYVRQAQAKSNTKEQAFNALSSIAAKTAQQRAANRKLAVLENMYNFRFTPSGRAINVNTPAQFNMQGSGMGGGRGLAEGLDYAYNSKGEIIGTRKVGKANKPSLDEIDNTFAKNGSKTSKKNSRNSSIVKALKNL